MTFIRAIVYGFALLSCQCNADECKDNVQELQATVQQQREVIQGLVERQKAIIKRLNDAVANIDVQQEHIKELEKTVADLKDNKMSIEFPQKRFLVDEGPVAFTAAIAPLSLDHVNSQEIIRFETTITDIGGAYNNKTGVFVVPISGIYLITSAICDHWAADQVAIHGDVNVHGEIVHNSKIVGRIYARAEDGRRDQGSTTVIISASEGDQVFVRHVDTNNVAISGLLYTSFSGVLLYPL